MLPGNSLKIQAVPSKPVINLSDSGDLKVNQKIPIILPLMGISFL